MYEMRGMCGMRRRLIGDAGDRGAMSLEMVLVTPIFIAFLMLLVGAGRLVDAQSQVEGAARDAVRSASVARSAGDAVQRADAAVAFSLSGHDWCSGGPRTDTDTNAWGAGGRVTVTVTCDAELGGLSFIGLPGTKTLTGRATAPIDTYTYRGGDGDGVAAGPAGDTGGGP